MWLTKKLLGSLGKDLKSPNQKLAGSLNDQLRATNDEYKEILGEAKAMTKLLEARRRIKDMRDSMHQAAGNLNDDVCPHGKTDDEDCNVCDADDDDQPDGVEKFIMDLLKAKTNTSGSGQPSQTDLSVQNAPISPFKQQILDNVMAASDDQLKKFIGQ